MNLVRRLLGVDGLAGAVAGVRSALFVGGLACLEWRWRELLRTA